MPISLPFGQLLVQTGSHPRYEDGDVLVAVNRRRIRHVHAEHICWPRKGGVKVGGELGTSQPLLETFFSNTYQYKFERVSQTEIKRITLATSDEEIFSDTPNAKGEQIDVEEFVDRRLAAGKLPMFGSAGAEVWYGGRTNASHANLDIIWREIESRTSLKEADHVHWPFSDRELSRFLALTVDDFDDAVASRLCEPLIDGSDPDSPRTVKKRKYHVPFWRDLPDVLDMDVLDHTKRFDIRGKRKFTPSNILQEKT